MISARPTRHLVTLLVLALAWPCGGAWDEFGAGSAKGGDPGVPAVRNPGKSAGLKRAKGLPYRLRVDAGDQVDELDDSDEAPAPTLKKATAAAAPLRLHWSSCRPATPTSGPAQVVSLPPPRPLRC